MPQDLEGYESLFLTSLNVQRRAHSPVSVSRQPNARFTPECDDSIQSDDLNALYTAAAGRADKTVVTPLQPFVCPPPPAKLSLKHRYYSLARTDVGPGRGMNGWEKAAILSRLRKVEPVDEAEFQLRLCKSRARNEDVSINRIRLKARESEELVMWEREKEFLAVEARREAIFQRHKNLLRLREQEQFVSRSRSWYNIIVCHVFLTALIQQRRVQEALETFSHLLAPMARRHVALKWKRRAQQELTKSQLPNIPFPYPQVIQSMYGTFFNGWPPMLLEKLVANATPTYLRKGSYLMHEGDIGRVMFMITTGTVSIILHKKGKDKRRCKANSNGVFQINAPCYVGEFALVCKEPRSASIYCETDIGYWAVLPEDYDKVAKYLSPEVASKQRESTDVRRRQNLKKFFPLKVDFLRKFPYFELFSNGALEKVIECVEPLVLHDGDYLYKSGQMDSSVYFIQDGSAVRRDADGTETKVPTGSCVGIFECSCGINTRKKTSIVSVKYCDVWRMTRETLIDVGMSEPVALLHCRKSAKADRALEIRRESKSPLFMRNDPYLAFCFPLAYINKMYEMCTPVVYLNGEKVTVMGQSVSHLVVLLSGTVDVTVTNSGEQETFRMDVAEYRSRYEGAVVRDTATLSIDGADGNDMSRDAGDPASTAQAVGGVIAHKGRRVTPTTLVTAVPAKEPVDDSEPPATSVTLVLGSYELAASVSQYTYTVTSFGLTEALQLDKSKLEAILPPALRSILHENLKARELVSKAYKRRALDLLTQNPALSFVQAYKNSRDTQHDKPSRRGNANVN